MEEEFHKFVSVEEIAKDLNLPKELAARVHKFWTLKRKVLLLVESVRCANHLHTTDTSITENLL